MMSKKEQCNQCDYASENKHNVRRHSKSKHMGAEFNCDKCDKTYKFKEGLNQHKLVSHNGKRYPCHICNYLATSNRSRKVHIHIEGVHENIKF